MAQHHNIEKSAFRPREYVGYGNGVWRIWRAGHGWHASRHDDRVEGEVNYLITPTLAEMSERLESVNQRVR